MFKMPRVMAESAIDKRAVPPGLLRGNGQFRLFWSARAVSFVGDGVATIALVLYVKEREDTGLAVAGLLLASSVPRLVGPLAGTIVDRLPPVPLMVSCDLGQAAIYLSIAAVRPPLPLLLVLVVFASLLATLFRPAGSGLVPRLVGPEQLLQANSWVGFALNLQLVCGPPLGALAFQQLGIRGALAINACTFLASATLLLRLRHLRAENARDGLTGSFMTEFRHGLAFVFGDRLLRIVVLTLFGSVLFAAVDNVALVFLTRNDLHASAIGYGAVAAVYGAGMAAAALTLTRLKRPPSPIAVFMGGLLVNGLGTLATGLATNLPFAAAAQIAAGAGNGADNIGGDTLVQQHTPAPLMGRAFGIVGTAAVLGGGLATLLAGALVELTSPRVTFLVGGIGVLLTALLALRIIHRDGPGPSTTR